MQSNYTNTKLKAWFRRLLRHPARKRSGSILNQNTPGPTQGDQFSKFDQWHILWKICNNNIAKYPTIP